MTDPTPTPAAPAPLPSVTANSQPTASATPSVPPASSQFQTQLEFVSQHSGTVLGGIAALRIPIVGKVMVADAALGSPIANFVNNLGTDFQKQVGQTLNDLNNAGADLLEGMNQSAAWISPSAAD